MGNWEGSDGYYRSILYNKGIAYLYPMKKLILCFVSLLLIAAVNGQVKRSVYIPKNRTNADTAFYYRWLNKIKQEIGIPNIINIPDTFYLRFWEAGRFIEIWTDAQNTLKGQVSFYARRLEDKKHPAQLFSNKCIMDDADARDIYAAYTQQNIGSVASSEEVEGYPIAGKDGEEYLFEICSGKKYTFKDYWSPSSYVQSIPEAKAIQDFVAKVDDIINGNKNYRGLKLPKGEYNNDGFGTMIVK